MRPLILRVDQEVAVIELNIDAESHYVPSDREGDLQVLITIRLPDGTNLEGRGVIPDVTVSGDWTTYSEKNDPQILRAVKLMGPLADDSHWKGTPTRRRSNMLHDPT